MFKTKKYFNIRKVAEAVSRLLSNSVDPLFYLSSFQTLSRKPRRHPWRRGFPAFYVWSYGKSGVWSVELWYFLRK